jgi:hypothetical protein
MVRPIPLEDILYRVWPILQAFPLSARCLP